MSVAQFMKVTRQNLLSDCLEFPRRGNLQDNVQAINTDTKILSNIAHDMSFPTGVSMQASLSTWTSQSKCAKDGGLMTSQCSSLDTKDLASLLKSTLEVEFCLPFART